MATAVRWACTTPFGCAVVPEVNRMAEVVSGPTPASAAGSGACPSTRRQSAQPSGTPPTPTTPRSSRASGRAASTRSAASAPATSQRQSAAPSA